MGKTYNPPAGTPLANRRKIEQEFGQRVQKLREAAGVTRQELQQALGYRDNTSVLYIENGERGVGIWAMNELCKQLKTSPNVLLGMAPVGVVNGSYQIGVVGGQRNDKAKWEADKKICFKVGQQVAKLRKKQGWSQVQLAEKLGTTGTSVSEIERGLKRMSIAALYNLAEVFAVTSDELLGLKPVGKFHGTRNDKFQTVGAGVGGAWTDADRERNIRIGKKIARLRKTRGMTQMELSGKIGIDYSSLSKVENGNQRLAASVVPLICQALGVSADELLSVWDDGE